jgi:hypothetical protein
MVQAQGILVGGMLSGFAGAILSVDYTQTGGNEMTKRRPRRAGLLPRPPLQPPHRAQRRPLAPSCAAVRHRIVVWVSDRTRPFAIVLIETSNEIKPLLPMAHLGVGVQSRGEVDRLCQLA